MLNLWQVFVLVVGCSIVALLLIYPPLLELEERLMYFPNGEAYVGGFDEFQRSGFKFGRVVISRPVGRDTPLLKEERDAGGTRTAFSLNNAGDIEWRPAHGNQRVAYTVDKTRLFAEVSLALAGIAICWALYRSPSQVLNGSAIEVEVRQLREEVERLRRERGGGTTASPEGSV